jgi:hypothetical protein
MRHGRRHPAARESATSPASSRGALAFVGMLSEIVRQLFFYVVTGEFLSAQYKENLRKLLKPLARFGLGRRKYH